MKRAAAFLFLFAIPNVVLAAGEMRPMLVATKSLGRFAVKSLAVGFDPSEPARNFHEFKLVNGFAANLTEEEIVELRKSAQVLFVEPDVERHAFSTSLRPIANASTPFAQVTPYGISLVHAQQAWVGGRGANTNVVVIDTGIDYRHPDLAARYAGGLNTIANNDDPLDDNGHGTHCSGTIAAIDDGVGVVGVAPQARLWAVKVLDEEGSGKSSNVLKALDWVVQKKTELGGNWIVSLSLGSCSPSTLERQGFERATTAGVLVVAAAGNHDPSAADVCTADNNNSYAVSYPAAYAGVVAVAAVNSLQSVADFSNFGPQVTLAAPGVDVFSTFQVGQGDWSLLTPNGGTPVVAPPVRGSPAKDITGPYVFCNLGKVGEFPASVNGKIALIKRGDITFKEKSKNAKAAGAAAVVIFNRDTSAILWTLLARLDANGNVNPAVCDNPETAASCHDDPADVAFDWPLTVGMPLADGEALVNQPKSSITINYRLDDDYAILSGTSMACPHVAGVAATVWSMAPSATADAIKQALISTAHDLGAPGPDNNYGNGLIDAEKAGKQINPGAFIPQPSKPTGRTPGRRH